MASGPASSPGIRFLVAGGTVCLILAAMLTGLFLCDLGVHPPESFHSEILSIRSERGSVQATIIPTTDAAIFAAWQHLPAGQ